MTPLQYILLGTLYLGTSHGAFHSISISTPDRLCIGKSEESIHATCEYDIFSTIISLQKSHTRYNAALLWWSQFTIRPKVCHGCTCCAIYALPWCWTALSPVYTKECQVNISCYPHTSNLVSLLSRRKFIHFPGKHTAMGQAQALQWRHNEHPGISNNRRLDRLFNSNVCSD